MCDSEITLPEKKQAGKWTKDEVFSAVTFLADYTVLD